MKNSAILLAAFSIAACGDGDGADTECSPDCDGQVPNGGLCVTFNSLRFTCGTVTCNMANCTVDTTDCRIHCGGGGRIEFETCSGNDCLIGMYCREGVTTDVNVCLTSCDRDATTDTCGASRECVQWSQTPGDGVCLIATATRDTGCFENYTVCIDGAGACGAAGYDDNGDEILRCKIECDEAAVGTPGSCAGSEVCLDSGVVRALTPDELCSDPGTPDTCTAGICYDGWAGGQSRCGNLVAFCGTEQPTLGEFDATSIQDHIDGGDGCNQIDDHRMCAIITDGNATADDEAQPTCSNLASPSGDGACIASCEDGEGNILDCGASFECCTPPAGAEFLFGIQLDGATHVVCTNPGTPDVCDTGNNYSCVAGFTGGSYCARPTMMCMTPGVSGAVCL